MSESMTLMVKLGSIARHAEELLSPTGSMEFDGAAIRGLLADPEVMQFMGQMDAAALLPVRRHDEGSPE